MFTLLIPKGAKMRLLSRFGIQVVGLAGLALPVAAQQVRPTLAPSVFAGVALPRGDVRSFTNMGFTTGASLDLSANSIPVALRAEAGYTHFAFTYTDLQSNPELSGGNRNQWNGGLDLVVPIPVRVATPYLLGGYGVYRVAIRPNCQEIAVPGVNDATIPTCPGSTSDHAGWSAGVGFDLPGGVLGSRVEARYTRIPIPGGFYSYVPVTFALRF